MYTGMINRNLLSSSVGPTNLRSYFLVTKSGSYFLRIRKFRCIGNITCEVPVGKITLLLCSLSGLIKWEKSVNTYFVANFLAKENEHPSIAIITIKALPFLLHFQQLKSMELRLIAP